MSDSDVESSQLEGNLEEIIRLIQEEASENKLPLKNIKGPNYHSLQIPSFFTEPSAEALSAARRQRLDRLMHLPPEPPSPVAIDLLMHEAKVAGEPHCSPSEFLGRLRLFYRAQKERLIFKKYKQRCRLAEVCKGDELSPETGSTFQKLQSITHLELDDASERFERLERAIMKDEFGDGTASAVPRVIEPDDVAIYVRWLCLRQASTHRLFIFLKRIQWIPYTARFEVLLRAKALLRNPGGPLFVNSLHHSTVAADSVNLSSGSTELFPPLMLDSTSSVRGYVRTLRAAFRLSRTGRRRIGVHPEREYRDGEIAGDNIVAPHKDDSLQAQMSWEIEAAEEARLWDAGPERYAGTRMIDPYADDEGRSTSAGRAKARSVEYEEERQLDYRTEAAFSLIFAHQSRRLIFQPLASAFPSSVMPTAEALAHNDASSDDVFDADFKSGLSSGVGGRDIETKISGPTSAISSGGSRSGPLLQGKHDNISYLKPSPWLPFVPLQAYVEEWQVLQTETFRFGPGRVPDEWLRAELAAVQETDVARAVASIRAAADLHMLKTRDRGQASTQHVSVGKEANPISSSVSGTEGVVSTAVSRAEVVSDDEVNFDSKISGQNRPSSSLFSLLTLPSAVSRAGINNATTAAAAISQDKEDKVKAAIGGLEDKDVDSSSFGVLPSLLRPMYRLRLLRTRSVFIRLRSCLNYFRAVQRRLTLDLRGFAVEGAMNLEDEFIWKEGDSGPIPPGLASQLNLFDSPEAISHPNANGIRYGDSPTTGIKNKGSNATSVPAAASATSPNLPYLHPSQPLLPWETDISKEDRLRFRIAALLPDQFRLKGCSGYSNSYLVSEDTHSEREVIRSAVVESFAPVVVEDAFGKPVLYDCAITDMDQLLEELLHVGTHFIRRFEAGASVSGHGVGQAAAAAASRGFVGPARPGLNLNTPPIHMEGFGKKDAIGSTARYVDRGSVMADLLECESCFTDAKVRFVSVLMETFAHSCDSAEQRRLAQAITDVCARRPRLDSAAFYFSAAYGAEIMAMDLEAKLLRVALNAQICEERAVTARLNLSTATAWSAKLRAEGVSTQKAADAISLSDPPAQMRCVKQFIRSLPTLLLSPPLCKSSVEGLCSNHDIDPPGLVVGAFELYSSASIIGRMLSIIDRAYLELQEVHRPSGPSERTALRIALLQEIMAEWRVFDIDGSSAPSSLLQSVEIPRTNILLPVSEEAYIDPSVLFSAVEDALKDSLDQEDSEATITTSQFAPKSSLPSASASHLSTGIGPGNSFSVRSGPIVSSIAARRRRQERHVSILCRAAELLLCHGALLLASEERELARGVVSSQALRCDIDLKLQPQPVHDAITLDFYCSSLTSNKSISSEAPSSPQPEVQGSTAATGSHNQKKGEASGLGRGVGSEHDHDDPRKRRRIWSACSLSPVIATALVPARFMSVRGLKSFLVLPVQGSSLLPTSHHSDHINAETESNEKRGFEESRNIDWLAILRMTHQVELTEASVAAICAKHNQLFIDDLQAFAAKVLWRFTAAGVGLSADTVEEMIASASLSACSVGSTSAVSSSFIGSLRVRERLLKRRAKIRATLLDRMRAASRYFVLPDARIAPARALLRLQLRKTLRSFVRNSNTGGSSGLGATGGPPPVKSVTSARSVFSTGGIEAGGVRSAAAVAAAAAAVAADEEARRIEFAVERISPATLLCIATEHLISPYCDRLISDMFCEGIKPQLMSLLLELRAAAAELAPAMVPFGEGETADDQLTGGTNRDNFKGFVLGREEKMTAEALAAAVAASMAAPKGGKSGLKQSSGGNSTDDSSDDDDMLRSDGISGARNRVTASAATATISISSRIGAPWLRIEGLRLESWLIKEDMDDEGLQLESGRADALSGTIVGTKINEESENEDNDYAKDIEGRGLWGDGGIDRVVCVDGSLKDPWFLPHFSSLLQLGVRAADHGLGSELATMFAPQRRRHEVFNAPGPVLAASAMGAISIASSLGNASSPGRTSVAIGRASIGMGSISQPGPGRATKGGSGMAVLRAGSTVAKDAGARSHSAARDVARDAAHDFAVSLGKYFQLEIEAENAALSAMVPVDAEAALKLNTLLNLWTPLRDWLSLMRVRAIIEASGDNAFHNHDGNSRRGGSSGALGRARGCDRSSASITGSYSVDGKGVNEYEHVSFVAATGVGSGGGVGLVPGVTVSTRVESSLGVERSVVMFLAYHLRLLGTRLLTLQFSPKFTDGGGSGDIAVNATPIGALEGNSSGKYFGDNGILSVEAHPLLSRYATRTPSPGQADHISVLRFLWGHRELAFRYLVLALEEASDGGFGKGGSSSPGMLPLLLCSSLLDSLTGLGFSGGGIVTDNAYLLGLDDPEAGRINRRGLYSRIETPASVEATCVHLSSLPSCSTIAPWLYQPLTAAKSTGLFAPSAKHLTTVAFLGAGSVPADVPAPGTVSFGGASGAPIGGADTNAKSSAGRNAPAAPVATRLLPSSLASSSSEAGWSAPWYWRASDSCTSTTVFGRDRLRGPGPLFGPYIGALPLSPWLITVQNCVAGGIQQPTAMKSDLWSGSPFHIDGGDWGTQDIEGWEDIVARASSDLISVFKTGADAKPAEVVGSAKLSLKRSSSIVVSRAGGLSGAVIAHLCAVCCRGRESDRGVVHSTLARLNAQLDDVSNEVAGGSIYKGAEILTAQLEYVRSRSVIRRLKKLFLLQVRESPSTGAASLLTSGGAFVTPSTSVMRSEQQSLQLHTLQAQQQRALDEKIYSQLITQPVFAQVITSRRQRHLHKKSPPPLVASTFAHVGPAANITTNGTLKKNAVKGGPSLLSQPKASSENEDSSFYNGVSASATVSAMPAPDDDGDEENEEKWRLEAVRGELLLLRGELNRAMLRSSYIILKAQLAMMVNERVAVEQSHAQGMLHAPSRRLGVILGPVLSTPPHDGSSLPTDSQFLSRAALVQNDCSVSRRTVLGSGIATALASNGPTALPESSIEASTAALIAGSLLGSGPRLIFRELISDIAASALVSTLPGSSFEANLGGQLCNVALESSTAAPSEPLLSDRISGEARCFLSSKTGMVASISSYDDQDETSRSEQMIRNEAGRGTVKSNGEFSADFATSKFNNDNGVSSSGCILLPLAALDNALERLWVKLRDCWHRSEGHGHVQFGLEPAHLSGAVARASQLEILLHRSETRYRRAMVELQLMRRSEEQRVTLGVMEQSLDLVLELDSLQRNAALARRRQIACEEQLREDIKSEYEDVVKDLALELLATKTRFEEYRNALAQGLKQQLTGVKRDVALQLAESTNAAVGSGSLGGKRIGNRAGDGAVSQIMTDLKKEEEQLALGSENAALRGALLRLKALYEMRALAEGAEAEHRIRHLRTRLASQAVLWEQRCEAEERLVALQRALAEAKSATLAARARVERLAANAAAAAKSQTALVAAKLRQAKEIERLQTKLASLARSADDSNESTLKGAPISLAELEQLKDALRRRDAEVQALRAGNISPSMPTDSAAVEHNIDQSKDTALAAAARPKSPSKGQISTRNLSRTSTNDAAMDLARMELERAALKREVLRLQKALDREKKLKYDAFARVNEARAKERAQDASLAAGESEAEDNSDIDSKSSWRSRFLGLYATYSSCVLENERLRARFYQMGIEPPVPPSGVRVGLDDVEVLMRSTTSMSGGKSYIPPQSSSCSRPTSALAIPAPSAVRSNRMGREKLDRDSSHVEMASSLDSIRRSLVDEGSSQYKPPRPPSSSSAVIPSVDSPARQESYLPQRPSTSSGSPQSRHRGTHGPLPGRFWGLSPTVNGIKNGSTPSNQSIPPSASGRH